MRTIISFFILFIIFLSCATTSSVNTIKEIDVNLSADKEVITLSFKNVSDKKVILPKSALLIGRIFQFENSPEISYDGILVHSTELWGIIDTTGIDMEKEIEKNCKSISKSNNYPVLLPNESFVLKYNILENYSGFISDKVYKITYAYNIESLYSDYCPLIKTGKLKSNQITFKIDN